MLRPLFFIMLALATSGAHLQTPAPKRPEGPGITYQVIAKPLPSIEAPADQYFGRYKLSSLSVRNAIYDMTIEGDSPLALPLQTGRIAAVESALPDWADKYPFDPWLPSAIVKFSVFLISKQEPEYDRAALVFLSYLEWAYPRTWYAKFARDKLADFDLHPNIDMLRGPTIGQSAKMLESYFPAVGIRRHRH
jgi:hypothetical protein